MNDKHLKLKVHWLNERCDDKDDNDGKHFGIYIFDCLEKDFDSELGYGSYDILQVHWFESEIIRDKKYLINE